MLTNDDVYLFNEGTLYQAADKLGAHPCAGGVAFSVWAPNAQAVSVIGDWNGWTREQDPLTPVGSSGIWSGMVKGAQVGQIYKYHIRSQVNGYAVDKGRPVRFRRWKFRHAPASRSPRSTMNGAMPRVDEDAAATSRSSPRLCRSTKCISARRQRRLPEEGNQRSLTYRELAPRLANYVRECGFTHVELMPVMEHPFYGSWGYQVTSYFAPSSRYGSPQDFMFLIDYLHQQGIGVILDWVPSHFPEDQHGLGYFDGTHLFEHADPRQGFHPDWKSAIFNYGRNEVRSFLISRAVFLARQISRGWLCAWMVSPRCSISTIRAKPARWTPRPKHGGGRESRRHRFSAANSIRRFIGCSPTRRPSRKNRPRGRRVSHPVGARRSRLRLQVGHGLDARHARLLRTRRLVPLVSPRRAHLPPDLRVHGKLRALFVT